MNCYALVVRALTSAVLAVGLSSTALGCVGSDPEVAVSQVNAATASLVMTDSLPAPPVTSTASAPAPAPAPAPAMPVVDAGSAVLPTPDAAPGIDVMKISGATVSVLRCLPAGVDALSDGLVSVTLTAAEVQCLEAIGGVTEIEPNDDFSAK